MTAVTIAAIDRQALERAGLATLISTNNFVGYSSESRFAH